MKITLLDRLQDIAADYDAFILDRWGVLHNGQKPYPGVVDCLMAIKRAGKKRVILSNAPRRIEPVIARITLKEVSAILKRSIREIDTASRYCGEEFILILPNTVKGNALVVAERMRMSIEQHTFHEIDRNITVSIGISGMPDEKAESDEKLVRCADFALYRTKQLGRNRTVTAAAAELGYVEEP